MKKQILLFGFLLLYYFALGQTTYEIIDTIGLPPNPAYLSKGPVGLGIDFYNEQQHIKEREPDILISQPTIISVAQKNSGVLHVKAFVNSDLLNIVLTRINQQNYGYYKAYLQGYYNYQGDFTLNPEKDVPQFDEKRAIEIPIIPADGEHVFTSYLDYNSINKNKFEGINNLFFIKDIRTNKFVSILALEFIFPKPEPLFLSFEPYMIETYENRQGEDLRVNQGFLADMREQVKASNLAPTNFNAKTNLPNQLILPSNKNTLLIQFKSLSSITNNYLEYRIDADSTFKTSAKNRNPVILLRNLKPGKHTLQVRYPRQEYAIFKYEFEVKPAFYQTTAFKAGLSGLAMVLLVGMVFTVKVRRQKRLLLAESTKRAQMQTQLSSLRAQLNPHFIFNALNSIQGLINKNDQEGANIYISKLGSLMRDILDKNEKVTHPLSQEIKQLEDYLQLEQLRFKFKYQLLVAETLNPTELDFPVMLLQPFAENAIKHGIAGKQEEGHISIWFKQDRDNLVVTVQDNGKGFDLDKPANGYGINLIKDRITVVNQLYPEQPIIFEFKSIPDAGTKVTLVLTDWL